MARATAKAPKAPKAAAKKEDAKASRMKKDPAAGADDFNKIPMGKAADTAAMVNRKEKEQQAPRKKAADQKKKQPRRGK